MKKYTKYEIMKYIKDKTLVDAFCIWLNSQESMSEKLKEIKRVERIVGGFIGFGIGVGVVIAVNLFIF